MSTPLGNFLRDELERRGWTQAELSRASGVGTSGLSSIVSGKTRLPEPETIRAIARALDIEGARLTALLGYPVDVGAYADRYIEINQRLDGAPWLVERLPDLLRLTADQFREAIAYLDFRSQIHLRNANRSTPTD